MIDRIYEVSCDYCGDCIIHAYNSKKNAEKEVIKVQGIVKGKYQFCSIDCYNKWINSGKKNILQEKT